MSREWNGARRDVIPIMMLLSAIIIMAWPLHQGTKKNNGHSIHHPPSA